MQNQKTGANVLNRQRNAEKTTNGKFKIKKKKQ